MIMGMYPIGWFYRQSLYHQQDMRKRHGMVHIELKTV